MGGTSKPSAKEAFDLNIEDAEILVLLVRLLENRRVRRMRRERRERLGTALDLPQKDWDELACLENEIAFVTFKPGYAYRRDQLNDPKNLRPLLRQAIVAGCAALETFCADRVMERMPEALGQTTPPPRLLKMEMALSDYLEIENRYKRKIWGLRAFLETEVHQKASPAPGKIVDLFSLIGERSLFARLDTRRRVDKGSTHGELARIVARRNRIAHTGDRSGNGRAPITIEEVREDLAILRSVVDALDTETRESR